MSASTKFTLWVLVLSITVLLVPTSLFFHIYGVDVFPFISLIWLLFLPSILVVWGKVRDSLSKKLEYFHKNYLLKLYIELRRSIFEFNPIVVQRIRPDLERYGKFAVLLLYPRKLVKSIDDFLSTYEEFDNRLREITEIGKKYCDMSLDRDLWLHLLDIKRLREADFQRYMSKQILFKLYADQAKKIRNEQAELIEETQNLLEQTEKMKKDIFEKLEDFLISNNLRLELEPVRHVFL